MFSFTYLTYVHMLELLPLITSLSIELIVVTSWDKVIISRLVKQSLIFALVWLWIIQVLYHTLFPEIASTFLKTTSTTTMGDRICITWRSIQAGEYLDPEEPIRHNTQKILAMINVLPVFGINPSGFYKLLSTRFRRTSYAHSYNTVWLSVASQFLISMLLNKRKSPVSNGFTVLEERHPL